VARADTTIAVTLRRRFAVGGEDDTVLAAPRLYPGDVATDGAGHLYLIDRPRARILVYDSRGRLARTLGRKGSGPSEMRSPIAIAAAADGAVTVVDVGKRALVRFASDGKPLAELPTRSFGVVQRLYSVSGVGTVAVANPQGRAIDTTILLRIAGAKVERIAVVPPLSTRDVPAWEACGLVGQASVPLLSPQLLVAGHGETIAFNQGGAFRLTIVDGAKAPRTVSRARSPDRATPDAARSILGDSVRMTINGRPCAIGTRLVLEQAGMSPMIPAYSALLVDARARVWAVRTAPLSPAAAMADVYDAQRGYIGTAKLGPVRPMAFLSDGGLVSFETDANDVPIVVVYDLTFPKGFGAGAPRE
jgi:hypothetical protein